MKTEQKQPVEQSVEQLRELNHELEVFNQKMPQMVSLTPEEREQRRSARLGIKKLELLRNQVTVAEQNQALLPASFDLPKLQQEPR